MITMGQITTKAIRRSECRNNLIKKIERTKRLLEQDRNDPELRARREQQLANQQREFDRLCSI